MRDGYCTCRKDSANQTLLYIESLGRMKSMLNNGLIFSYFFLFSPICSCELSAVLHLLRAQIIINGYLIWTQLSRSRIEHKLSRLLKRTLETHGLLICQVTIIVKF